MDLEAVDVEGVDQRCIWSASRASHSRRSPPLWPQGVENALVRDFDDVDAVAVEQFHHAEERRGRSWSSMRSRVIRPERARSRSSTVASRLVSILAAGEDEADRCGRENDPEKTSKSARPVGARALRHGFLGLEYSSRSRASMSGSGT